MPIVLYNHPHTSGVNFDESFLPHLIEIEWVVATKESAGDFNQLARLLVTFGDQIDVLTGYSARHGAFGAMLGSPAFIGAMEPQILGAEGISLFELGATGQVERAIALQKRCIRLGAIGKIGSSPANIKGAMNLLGRPGGHCRNPIDDLTSAESEQVSKVLDDLDVFSSPACRL
jgi:4-hydroxy-tetrahydrodipicolinate synthase